jgi:hypothetical protein
MANEGMKKLTSVLASVVPAMSRPAMSPSPLQVTAAATTSVA